MPDVFIWMIRGEKRLAYARVPAHEILHSTTCPEASGKYCGKTQTVFLKVQLTPYISVAGESVISKPGLVQHLVNACKSIDRLRILLFMMVSVFF